jgi:uncharacterized protein (TIGR00290 family)
LAAPRAALFWSGGKDSALALDRVRRSGECDVVSLVSTINPEYGRVSMHGVREALVKAQAAAVGLPLEPMHVGSAGGNEAYVTVFRETLTRLKARGVEALVFGDIFIADLRAWREALMAECGMAGIFPLWGEETGGLAREFVARGFKALICCASDPPLDASFAGRPLDERFLDALPEGVDPCGENGEYHSFVHDGPIFERPIAFAPGPIVYRSLSGGSEPEPAGEDGEPAIGLPAAPAGTATRGFWFHDLLPKD